MTANELDLKVMEYIRHLDVNPLMPHFELVGDGQKLQVLGQADHAALYYQWLGGLMRFLKPKQVVELGAAAGVSTIMLALNMPKDSTLISVDNDPTAWQWIKYEYPQLSKIHGSDLDLSIYPKDCNLKKTDVWFIDTNHQASQLRKEIELYKPFWKKGTVVVLDDIRTNDMFSVWEELPYDKFENTNPCHWSGFGFFIYDL